VRRDRRRPPRRSFLAPGWHDAQPVGHCWPVGHWWPAGHLVAVVHRQPLGIASCCGMPSAEGGCCGIERNVRSRRIPISEPQITRPVALRIRIAAAIPPAAAAAPAAVAPAATPLTPAANRTAAMAARFLSTARGPSIAFRTDKSDYTSCARKDFRSDPRMARFSPWATRPYQKQYSGNRLCRAEPLTWLHRYAVHAQALGRTSVSSIDTGSIRVA